MKKQLLPAIIGIVVALLAGLIILWAQGYPPLQSYAALFSYSLFSRFAFFSTLDKATPLILTGLSAAVGVRKQLCEPGPTGSVFDRRHGSYRFWNSGGSSSGNHDSPCQFWLRLPPAHVGLELPQA